MKTTERTKEAMLEKMQKMNKENGMNTTQKKAAVQNFKNAIKIGNKVFLDIPIESLKIDHEMYQRPIQRHVRTIAKNWEEDKCDPLMVNYRNDGFFYVIDGQHRKEAAEMRGIESLVCVVFVGLTIKEEADMFTEQNEGTKKLTPYDTFKANICRGEKIDTQIKEVCDAHGITVEKANKIRTLKSVTTARAIIKNHGKENLDWIFDVLNDSGWNAYKKTYTDGMMSCLNNIKVNYAEELFYIRGKIVEFFKTTTPKEFQALANAEYPYMGRTACLYALLDEILKEENQNLVVGKFKTA